MKATQQMIDAAIGAVPGLSKNDAEHAIQAALDVDPTIKAMDGYAGQALIADIRANLPMPAFGVSRREGPIMVEDDAAPLGVRYI